MNSLVWHLACLVTRTAGDCRSTLWIAVWLCSCTCYAQSDRYELGKRVRRFEVAWQTADTERRAASATPMQQAVKSFFTLQYANAARELDNAYFIASQSSLPTDFARVAIGLRMQVQPVAIESQTATCQFKLQPYYQPKQAADDARKDELADAKVTVTLLDSQQRTQARFDVTGQSALAGIELKFKDVAEGDYWLQADVASTEQKFSLPPMQVSLVNGLETRLKKLEEWLKAERAADQRTDETDTLRLTVRQATQTLRSQVEQRALETDYPAQRLLKFSEALVDVPERAAELIREQAPASIWLTLSHKRKSVAVRVQTPDLSQQAKSAQASPLPVLIAFHGAGGSENMFFETYGAGRLVDLATERGWIVVAPRHPLLGIPLSYREMIEALRPFFPIDSQRVYLVGHSMGAAEVVRQVSLEAQAPQAAVALGGGGSAKNSQQFVNTPWFVAAGELDFGRGGAKSLADRLESFKCRVDYREYADVEHMVIVQAALDDVFEYLDQHRLNSAMSPKK